MQQDSIDQVLAERGRRYGEFSTHADLTQQLKRIANGSPANQAGRIMPLHAEALAMIFHKVGRILNGDPDYIDSWVDIAGYAKLVADELQRRESRAAAVAAREGAALAYHARAFDRAAEEARTRMQEGAHAMRGNGVPTPATRGQCSAPILTDVVNAAKRGD